MKTIPLVMLLTVAAILTGSPGETVTWALTLTAPKPDTVLLAGGVTPVVVEVGKDVNLRSVKYYWYRADEEPISSHQATPAAFTAAEAGAPFSGTLRVPTDALGSMRLLAIGEVTRGRLAGHDDFDEVSVTVESPSDLTSVEFAVEKPWRLHTIGKRVVVPAVGQFTDGGVRLLTGPGARSTYRSSNEAVVLVDATGMLRVKGNGSATVTVSSRGKSGTIDIHVEADEGQNSEPVARVVPELSVKAGALVVLDGMQSYDPDGDPLRYEWRQVRGHPVSLTTVHEAKATFMAPPVSDRKQFQFTLVVTDMAGPDVVKGAESPAAVVTVWISP